MLSLLSVNNISSAAYALLPPRYNFSFRSATPAEIYRRVQGCQCDAALLPVACLEEGAAHYDPIGDYGIACRGTVESVLLFCDAPLSKIAAQNLPIFVSEHSQTSRALFQSLYEKKFGVPPTLTLKAADALGRVYIGNEALKMVQGNTNHAEVIDLCHWWYQDMNLPFVFARWVVRASLSSIEKESIGNWLEDSTFFAETHHGKHQMALNNKEAFTSIHAAQDYYDNIQFRLGHDEYSGLELFQTIIQESVACTQIA